MASDQNKGPNLSFLGSQVAQAWQKGLETWWQTLLSDRTRLAELANSLGAAGLGTSNGPSTQDMVMLVQSMKSIEMRLFAAEGQIKGLTESLANMIQYLESLKAAKTSPQPDRLPA